ncbi:MAG: polysaccharide lyase [Cyclobacteriaceae bacterium]
MFTNWDVLIFILFFNSFNFQSDSYLNESFEEGIDYSLWKNQKGIVDETTIVDTLAFVGSKSLRIVHSFDSTSRSERNELVLRDGPLKKIRHGEHHWFRVAYYIPVSWEFEKSPKMGEIVSQWHHGLAHKFGGPSPMAIIIDRDHWKVKSSFGDPHSKGNFEKSLVKTNKNVLEDELLVEKGKWNVWLIHSYWSNSAEGLIEGWLNGEKVFIKKGPNCYANIDLYWKIGIYKPAWYKNRRTTSTLKREIFIDGLVHAKDSINLFK